MKPRPFSSAALLSCLVLASVTLFVFFVLQDYGPESSLRKFHEASVLNDYSTLREITTGAFADEDTKADYAVIRTYLLANNGHYRLLRTDHRRGWVGAEVQYIFPNGQTRTIYWVVRKVGHEWKVDSTATNNVMAMPQQGQGAPSRV